PARPSPACSPCRGRGRSARGGPTRPGPCSGSAPCSERRSGRTRGRTARPGRPPPLPPPSPGTRGGTDGADPVREQQRAGPAASGRRLPAALGSVAAVPDGAVAAAGRRPPPAADALRLREVLSRLSLLREDVSEASTLVNTVVPHLVQAIRDKDSCFSSIERQSAGSYYERVKISEPNEFDIMLVMPVTRIQLDESDDTGAYYYVSFKRSPKEKGWLKFLEEDGKLSAFKMLQALREIIKQEVKNIKGMEVTVARKKAGSPAITLQIKKPPLEISVDIILTLEAQQSWPCSTQAGLKIEQWLGTKKRRDFRFRSIYLQIQGHSELSLILK
uniref:Mab-21-like nucleotidyltransferase domain-containing protein n=1 Tax=Geospiza parvula TaxID=87175 RepID=A0A8C3N753_GEOPR